MEPPSTVTEEKSPEPGPGPGPGAPRPASRIERATRRGVAWGRKATQEPFSWVPLLGLAVVAVGYGASAIALRVWYEAQGAYNVDTLVYWAVGRGIVEGYTPYLDLHETKPPGIFLLSALSYLLTGGGALTHATQVLSILAVTLAPLAYLPRALRERPRLAGVTSYLGLLSVALAVSTFAGDHGCEVQTEIHGLAGMVGYMLLLGSRRRFAFAGRAAMLLLAIGMKEPFLLLVPPVYWILSTDETNAWDDLVGPLALALLTGTLFLLVTGWLSPYVGIYLRSMAGGHVQMHDESLWSRGLSAIDRGWNEVRQYSILLPTTLFFVAGVFVLSPSRSDETGGALVRRFSVVFAGALLAGLAVGMGGHFYGHHFVFATPLHLALVFALLARGGAVHPVARSATPLLVVLGLLSVVLPSCQRPSDFSSRLAEIQAHDREAKAAAADIDHVLDQLGVDRYLCLGHPGWAPLPFTRHIPLGPLFFQQVMFFEGKFPWLANQFKHRLAEAEVVFFAQHMTGPLEGHVKRTLARDFRPLPKSVLPEGTRFPYKAFVRTTLVRPGLPPAPGP